MGLFRKLGKAFYDAVVHRTQQGPYSSPGALGAALDAASFNNIWPTAPKPTTAGFTLEEHKELMGDTSLATDSKFFRSAGNLMRDYWLSPKGAKGWLLLAGAVALNFTNVWLATKNLDLNQEFIFHVVKGGTMELPEAVRTQHATDAWKVFGMWAGAVIPALIATSVYFSYIQGKLNLDWRKVMTNTFINKWMENKNFHRLSTVYNKTADNPEQRIEKDIDMFTGRLVDVPLGLLHAGTTLVAFSAMLWKLSDQIQFKIGGWEFTSDLHLNLAEKSVGAPGYLFMISLIYATAGTGLAHWIGKKLIDINRTQEQFNADFRAGMARVRENSESIAFFGGEEREKRKLISLFKPVAENWDAMLSRNKKMAWFNAYYGQAADMFPYVAAAPAVMSGALDYSELIKARQAMAKVDYGLQWFVSNYQFLASLVATTQRLTSFDNDLDQANVDFRRTNLAAAGEAGGMKIKPSGP